MWLNTLVTGFLSGIFIASNYNSMNRRHAIRSAFIFSAGAILLPSCLQKDTSAIPLTNISIDSDHQKMLAQLAATIMPTTNFIGAKELNAHQFIMTMVDDCYAPDKQQIFLKGMKEFSEKAKNKYGNPFADCTQKQKIEWLTAIENKQGFSNDMLSFYATAKQFTLQAFVSSKQYMVGIKKYNMVPGPIYKGCIPLKNTII